MVSALLEWQVVKGVLLSLEVQAVLHVFGLGHNCDSPEVTGSPKGVSLGSNNIRLEPESLLCSQSTCKSELNAFHVPEESLVDALLDRRVKVHSL
jgi:hypothetical protein